MASKWVITYLYMGYTGVIAHLLTIDPNFLGHPSTLILGSAEKHCNDERS